MDYLKHAKALKDEIRATVINYLEVNNIPLSAIVVKVDEGSPSKSSVEVQFKPMGRDQLLENRYKFPLLIETDET